MGFISFINSYKMREQIIMFDYKFIVNYLSNFDNFLIRMIDTNIEVEVSSGDFLLVKKEIEFMDKDSFEKFTTVYVIDSYQSDK